MKVISTKELVQWMPHRPPMVWVDAVTRVEEMGGEAIIELQQDGYYMSDGKLRASSLIEFCAQAYGFVRAAWELTHEVPPPRLNQAFLAAVGSVDWEAQELPNSGTLKIEVKTKRQVGPLRICEGRIFHGNRQLVSLVFKVFADEQR